MSIQGSLQSINVMELFSSLLQWNKTGVLTILTEREERSFLFYEGNLVYATSHNSARRLGAFLVRLGYVKAEDVERSMQRGPSGPGHFGERLIADGKITPKQLRAAVRAQLFDIFLEVLRWRQGAFVFDDHELPFTVSEGSLNSTQSLLLEAATRLDENSLVSKIPLVDPTATSSEDGEGWLELGGDQAPLAPWEESESSTVRPDFPWTTVAPDTPSTIFALETRSADETECICSVIGREPMLAAKVLKLLSLNNIAVPREQLSIQSIVELLGTFNARCLLLPEAVRRLWFPPGEGFWRECWEHDQICAKLCESIAQRVGYPYVGEAYLAGLLHNVGAYILYTQDPAGYRQLVTDSLVAEQDVEKLERERYRTTHTEIGATYARAHKFPPAVEMAIRDHHRLGRGLARPLLHILNAANAILDDYGYRLGYHEGAAFTVGQSLEALGLSEEELLSLFITARSQCGGLEHPETVGVL